MEDVPPRAFVITGASTGIGRAAALRLAREGFQVFAGVRRAEDGESLAAEAGGALTPVHIDVTDADSIEAAARTVAGAVGERGLAGLVNNAGIANAAPLELLPLDLLRQQLEVNLVGQVAVTQAFLPLLRRGRGRVVNMGSIGGRIALPVVGAYAISKFGMEAFNDSLRREVHQFGIEVAIVEPGAIATPIWEKSTDSAYEKLEEIPPEQRELYGDTIEAVAKATAATAGAATPPEKVADRVVHALTARRPRTRYPVGREVRLRLALSRLLPARAFDALIRRAMGT